MATNYLLKFIQNNPNDWEENFRPTRIILKFLATVRM